MVSTPVLTYVYSVNRQWWTMLTCSVPVPTSLSTFWSLDTAYFRIAGCVFSAVKSALSSSRASAALRGCHCSRRSSASCTSVFDSSPPVQLTLLMNLGKACLHWRGKREEQREIHKSDGYGTDKLNTYY